MLVRAFGPSLRGLREEAAAAFRVKVLHRMVKLHDARRGQDIGVYRERATKTRANTSRRGGGWRRGRGHQKE